MVSVAVGARPRVWVAVRRERRGFGVWVQTPDGREFLLRVHRRLAEAARAARKEASWWRGQGYPVCVVGLRRER